MIVSQNRRLVMARIHGVPYETHERIQLEALLRCFSSAQPSQPATATEQQLLYDTHGARQTDRQGESMWCGWMNKYDVQCANTHIHGDEGGDRGGEHRQPEGH